MRALGLCLLLVAGLAAGGAARADAWGPPSVAFVADMVFRNGAGDERKARLYYTPGRQRLEYVAGKEPVALVVDDAAKKSWLLLLNHRKYRPVPFARPDYFLGVENPASKRRKLGSETLLGRPVDRLEVRDARTRTGDRFDGTAWVTAQRIVVRLKGTVVRGRRTQKIAMTMTRLTVGPVDPTLLRLPPNYTALPPRKPRR